MSDRVMCANEDHPGRQAAARVSYPSGRFKPTTACRADLRWMVTAALDEGHSMVIDPVAAGRPRIVVLCGSTRFRPEFAAVNRELTLAGAIASALGVPPTPAGDGR